MDDTQLLTSDQIVEFQKQLEQALIKGIFPNQQVVDCSILAELVGEVLFDLYGKE